MSVYQYSLLQKTLEETKNQIKEMVKANKKLPKEYFLGLAQDLFIQNPDLVSFSWNQYTPYFNDGDTCYFEAWTSYPTINKGEDNKELSYAVRKFLESFDNDKFLELFGDHVQVEVSKDNVKISEFDHE